jgi:sugar/nucleoside kinase (ribokinase family)
MDSAKTLDTKLNVLGDFRPTLPDHYKETPYVFLANTDPNTQIHVRKQLKDPKFVMLDTMNFWIDGMRDQLIEAMTLVDGVIMNDDEARSLGNSHNLIVAMQTIARLGVRTLVVKKGEHGSMLLVDGQLFALPAYPLEEVKDPTGAGDTFASGFMGHLAQTGDLSFGNMKRALAYGTVVASFTVEGFGLEGVTPISRADIDRRLDAFLGFTRF